MAVLAILSFLGATIPQGGGHEVYLRIYGRLWGGVVWTLGLDDVSLGCPFLADLLGVGFGFLLDGVGVSICLDNTCLPVSIGLDGNLLALSLGDLQNGCILLGFGSTRNGVLKLDLRLGLAFLGFDPGDQHGLGCHGFGAGAFLCRTSVGRVDFRGYIGLLELQFPLCLGNLLVVGVLGLCSITIGVGNVDCLTLLLFRFLDGRSSRLLTPNC